jgi:L-fuconolactonase
MKIDSHHHFWNYLPAEYPWIGGHLSVLKQDFGVAELSAVAKPHGIERVISVQARQSVAETQWLLDIAKTNEIVAGVVGWVPLLEANLSEFLEQFSSNSKLKGVRHVVQDEPDDEFILGTAFNHGVAKLREFGLVYDILIFAKHLKASIEFVDRHPEQLFVLDHIAKPTIFGKQFDSVWQTDLRELAKRENVACKFSGVATEVRDESWSLEVIEPYWQTALEAFGAQRLMFGSDWPVCLLKSDYGRWVGAAAKLSSQLSPDEQSWFWSKSAQRWYALNP